MELILNTIGGRA